MRFENDTPTSRLLGFVTLMQGRRSALLILQGFLYDNLGGRRARPKLDLKTDPAGRPLAGLWAGL